MNTPYSIEFGDNLGKLMEGVKKLAIYTDTNNSVRELFKQNVNEWCLRTGAQHSLKATNFISYKLSQIKTSTGRYSKSPFPC